MQTGPYASPVRRGETIDMSPEDAGRLGVRRRASRCACGRGAAVSWRRCTSTTALRPGLTFMTFHFPDEVATNHLTIDAVDPKSGTAEFKAAAVQIEAVEA